MSRLPLIDPKLDPRTSDNAPKDERNSSRVMYYDALLAENTYLGYMCEIA